MAKCQKCGKELTKGQKIYAKGRWPDGGWKKVYCEECAIKERKKANFVVAKEYRGNYL